MSLKPKNINYNHYWTKLSNVALQVLKCENISTAIWNSSFTDVYEICVAKKDGTEVYAESLYMDTYELMKQYVAEIQFELNNADLNVLLPLYVKKWKTFHTGLNYLNCLYSYVNSQHVKNRRPTDSDISYSQVVINVNENNMEINEMGLELWKSTVQKIGDNITECLLREIERDRVNEKTSQFECIAAVISSLKVIGETLVSNINKTRPYEDMFEEPFLVATVQYYQKWSAEKSGTNDASYYVTAALELRNQEEHRCKHCYPDSMKKTTDLFRDNIVVKQITFLNSSMKTLVENNQRTDLQNLYCLLSPYDLCAEIRNQLYDHVVKAVRNTLITVYSNNQNPYSAFVMNLTKSRNYFYDMNKEIFQEDTQFRNVIDKAFNKAINEKHKISTTAIQPSTATNNQDNSENSEISHSQGRSHKPADLLNRFVDFTLKKHSRTPSSDTEFNMAITNFITLFKYIDDKDAFQKLYQRSFCKRLIFSHHLHMEYEEDVISQIKTVCGLEYTNTFQRMFQDIQLVTQLNQSFNKYVTVNPDIPLPCSSQFTVLTSCSWPITSNPIEFNVNSDLLNSFGVFYKFYTAKYQGRELKLTNQFSTVELQTNFASRQYIITVNLLQATILLHFNTKDTDILTNDDLIKILGINSEGEIDKVLSLFVENKMIIRKDSLTYQLNREFTSKRIKLKLIPLNKDKESSNIVENDESVDRQINDDRKFFIQAAIVRIMKSRKQLNHTMLMKEVLDQAKGRFLPAIPMIKKCIDILIDKCYLERNPDNTDMYIYLA